jgi:hypothetical protein
MPVIAIVFLAGLSLNVLAMHPVSVQDLNASLLVQFTNPVIEIADYDTLNK